jgi:hypothetical protein
VYVDDGICSKRKKKGGEWMDRGRKKERKKATRFTQQASNHCPTQQPKEHSKEK